MELAMSFGTLETVQLLIDAASYDNEFPYGGGAEVWQSITRKPEWLTNTLYYSCVLWYATEMNKLVLAKFALDHGADANISSGGRHFSSSALQNAARCGNVNLFNLLITHEADIRLRYPKERGLLSGAVSGGSQEIVEACLDAGVEHAGWNTSVHPLVAAVNGNSTEMLQLLLERGVDFEVDSELDKQLVNAAAELNNADIDSILKLARDRQNE